MSNEMMSTGGRKGSADMNLNFIQEEIAPGMKTIVNSSISGTNNFPFVDNYLGIIVEGYVADL